MGCKDEVQHVDDPEDSSGKGTKSGNVLGRWVFLFVLLTLLLFVLPKVMAFITIALFA